MKGVVKFHKEPHPRACNLIAAWPGIGNVSLIVAQYLRDKLQAEEIGEILPFDFFDPIGVVVRDNIVETPQFPESKFYYWKNPNSETDIVLFIGEEQPGFKGYELAQCVLETVQKFKVKRIYTFAAALTRIHHTETPKVWGVATKRELIDELKKYEIVLRGDIHIAGLNGLFLGVAKEKGVDGICLLGEVPTYATRIPNPKAALAILKVLTEILGIEISLGELISLAREAEEEMKKVAAEAMGEFIDQFTKPIWEEEPREEEEE